MRILHLGTYDNIGGVARAAYRLHQGMLKAGYDSHFLCVVSETNGKNVHTVTKNTCKPLWLNKLIRLYKRIKHKTDQELLKKYPQKDGHFSTANITTNFLHDLKKINPDVVHIHWINELCRIEDIKKIRKPIFWNLHDSSVFTGGCHVLNNCDKYKTHCGNCPILKSGITKDLSYDIFERKKKQLKSLPNISIISSSRWMAENSRSSYLFRNKVTKVIPTGIDCDFFKPVNSSSLNKTSKNVILFGANAAIKDKNKGFELLEKSLNDHSELFKDCEIWVFGSDKSLVKERLKINVRVLGFVEDNDMPELYRSASLTVIPSYQECFGQVTIESMACGTPVVAFGATGLLDTVEHKVTGYLAKPYETTDLAKGIRWVLDKNVKEQLGRNARNRVLDLFEIRKVVEQNIAAYQEFLNQKR